MWILWLSLMSVHAYDFEISRGPSIEFKALSSVQDTDDDQTGGGGLRLGWSLANLTDSYVSGEIDFSYHRYFDKDVSKKNKYLIDGNVVFYELFNPAVFRLALGAGVERRFDKNRLALNYRLGLGHYFTKHMALYGDFTGRGIFREKAAPWKKFDLSSSLEIALGLQGTF